MFAALDRAACIPAHAGILKSLDGGKPRAVGRSAAARWRVTLEFLHGLGAQAHRLQGRFPSGHGDSRLNRFSTMRRSSGEASSLWLAKLRVSLGVVASVVIKLLFLLPNSPFLAEGVGFEPTRDLATPGGFQDRCLKPLGHPSISTRSDT